MRKLGLFETEEMVFEFRMLGFWIEEDNRKKLKESWEEYENELWSTTANGQRWGEAIAIGVGELLESEKRLGVK